MQSTASKMVALTKSITYLILERDKFVFWEKSTLICDLLTQISKEASESIDSFSMV